MLKQACLSSASISILFLVLISPLGQRVVAVSPYNSGYSHGCSDAKAGGRPYLDTLGKGASFHTNEFMKGYNDGYNFCTDQGERNSSGSSAGQFKVIVRLAYSPETDEALCDNPHARAPLRLSVQDKIKTVNLYNAIKGTLGKPILVVFVFKKGEIPVGQTFTACVQDLDRSITPPNKECKTVFNSSEKKPAIINFDIG